MNQNDLETYRRLASGYTIASREWIRQYAPVRIIEDPYETEEAESFLPAPSAYILAQASRWSGLRNVAEEACLLLNRCADLLQSGTLDPETHALTRFYSLLAWPDLISQAHDSWRSEWEKAFILKPEAAPATSSGAALQTGAELLSHHLGLRVSSLEAAAAGARSLAGRQQPGGFIADDGDGERRPIAAHLAGLSYLAAALSMTRDSPEPEVQAVLREADGVFEKGFAWLLRFLTPEGPLAMVGKGRHGVESLGHLLALFAYAGLSPDADTVLDTLAWWFACRRETGLFPAVPNHFPASLRIGYEPRTRFAASNALAFAGICLAGRIWEGEEYAACPQQPEERRIEAVIREDCAFIDEAGGYARLRSGEHFLAVSLRSHREGTAPAWQPFGVRLGGGRLSPLPEPAFDREAMLESVWEGFVVETEGAWRLPERAGNGSALACRGGIELTGENDLVAARKWLGFDGDRLVIEYEVTALRDLGACRAIWPVILSDGKEETAYRVEDNILSLTIGPESFSIACPERLKWRLGLARLFSSPSGAAAPAYFTPAPRLPRGAIARWSVAVEREFM
ncbi:MAG: hypothetical protein IT210_25665 [Armatimonadetes bacterium]|nr:hypothetical protein [Armatimonadota bacterium]